MQAQYMFMLWLICLFVYQSHYWLVSIQLNVYQVLFTTCQSHHSSFIKLKTGKIPTGEVSGHPLLDAAMCQKEIRQNSAKSHWCVCPHEFWPYLAGHDQPNMVMTIQSWPYLNLLPFDRILPKIAQPPVTHPTEIQSKFISSWTWHFTFWPKHIYLCPQLHLIVNLEKFPQQFTRYRIHKLQSRTHAHTDRRTNHPKT